MYIMNNLQYSVDNLAYLVFWVDNKIFSVSCYFQYTGILKQYDSYLYTKFKKNTVMPSRHKFRKMLDLRLNILLLG